MCANSRKSRKKSNFNQRGSILIPLLMALGVTFASLSVYFYQMTQIRRLDSNRILVTYGLKAFTSSVQALILSQKALVKTLKSPLNGNLWRCANDVEYSCSQTAPIAMSLLTETGDDTNPFVNATAGTGLSISLAPCTGYPSLTCPFRYELHWHSECPTLAASCPSPDIIVEGNLLIASSVAGVIALNPETYNLSIKVK